MAITSNFVAPTLTTTGDDLANTITTSRDAAGNILVNGGAVPITGGTPTVANTSLIQVFGLGLSDTITLDESLGALPAADLSGGDGNDTMTGGSGGDQINGDNGDDALLGRGGSDILRGGIGNDTLTGGDGDDQMFGDAGNDRMIWNPGDDSDVMEGGADTDTAEVNGGNGAETFTATANGTRVRFDRVTPAPFSLDIGTTENLVLNMNGGDDTFSTSGNLAALISIRVDGGAGNDSILGGNGADFIIGGDGDDFVDGNQGNDVALLGAGNDVFQWDPGDGSDTIEGQDGTDTLLFNGSAGNEIFVASANGGRLLFTRDVGNIVMDADDVEHLTLNAGAGVDAFTVNDLTGTDVSNIAISLAGTIGGSTGDALADTVTVNGTSGDDLVSVAGSGTAYVVGGLAVQVDVTVSEANDRLVINGLGGNDTINAASLAGGVVALTIDGGAGDDIIVGSTSADTLIGGDNDDTVTGRQGNDTAFLGLGNDTFKWSPGDGSDTIEGQGGTDTLEFNGANINENIDISANGARVRFFRDVANVTMDLDDVEQITYHALGGTDNVVINDLSGTDVPSVLVDLESALGSGVGDGQVDRVTINSTIGADAVAISSAAVGTIVVTGSPSTVTLAHAESTDQLVINANAGDDVIDASGLPAGRIDLTLNGGLGDDIFIGSQGADRVVGGDGDDTALMGAGNDVFVWNPGDDNDILEGQSGTDTLEFNGANIAENIDISANGGRVQFFRDIGNVVTDLDDVEQINFHAVGGVDNIVVHDLSGTDLPLGGLLVDLESAIGSGAGDSQVDSVTIDGTAGADVIAIATGVNGVVLILGSPAPVTVAHAESSDRLFVNGAAGNDTFNALSLAAGTIALTMNGGLGDDTYFVSDAGGVVAEKLNEGRDTVFSAVSYTLTPNVEDLHLTGPGNLTGNGNDLDNFIDSIGANNTLFGGAGKDTLVGGTGVDSLYGGLGDDVYIVHNAASGAFENAGEGFDTVKSDVDYTLGSNVEDLQLLAGAISGTGNNLSNMITGNASANIIDGGTGIDSLFGGGGNDIYIIHNSASGAIENAAEGIDTVRADVDYVLGSNVENLDLMAGAGAINGTGNNLDNLITGNASANTIDGGTGIDLLFGGGGNDIYIVRNSATGAFENAGEGTDTVKALGVSYILGSHVENLDLIGAGALNGTGNNLDNIITGNILANIIDGGTGVDSLFGGRGNDIYIVRNSATGAFENAAEGTDTVKALGVSYILGSHVENLDLIGAGALNGTGNNLDNLITGNILANVLDGGIGVDMLYGGLGDDTYIIHNSASGAIENPGEGTDVVIADVSYVLGSNVENLALIGAGAINGTGNNLDNTITGNSVGNILDGGTGEDILFGAGGGDTLFANSAGDQLYGSTGDDVYYLTTGALGAFENAAEGTDWVFISGNYSLGSNIENLVLTGTGDFFGAGNGLDNLIYSNNHSDTLSGGIGGDTLVGGTGIDAMYGGVGNDLYYVHNSSAGAFENAGEGTDWVFADASFTLGSNVENIVLTGAGAIDATGNGANNRIEGNTGNNNLIGNGGADRFVFAAAGTHHDTIYDFDSINVSAGHDLIDFQGRGLNFGALTINQVGADTQILIGGDEITLKNVLKTSVDAGDFLF